MEKIKFASNTEISQREQLLQYFIQNILGLPWAFTSDLSTLADFEGMVSPDELKQRLRLHYNYALLVEDMQCPLWQLLDKLEHSRKLN